MKFTSNKFFLLLLISHISFFAVLVYAPIIHILITFLIFVIITQFSSTLVYHRLLSHRSWDAPRWYEIFATIIGIFSFTGTPVTRTLAHRYHHAYTDTEKDPHSPRVMDLFHVYFPMLQPKKLSITLVRDIWNDKFHRFIHNHYLSIILSVVLISLWFLGIWWTMTLFVAPGALCWANISLCNILCHYGKAGDPIKQSTLLAWLTFGEGYHRHHHDFPADPDFSNAVGVDPGYFLIKLLRKSPR